MNGKKHRGVKREMEDAFQPEKYGLSSTLFGDDTNMFHEFVVFLEPHMRLQCYRIFQNCKAFLDMFVLVLENEYETSWGLCGIAKHQFWSAQPLYAYEAYFEDLLRDGWTTPDGREVKAWVYDSDNGPLSIAFHLSQEKQLVGLIFYNDVCDSQKSWKSSFAVDNVIAVQEARGHSVYHSSFLYATSKQVVYVDPDKKKRYVIIDTRNSDLFPIEDKEIDYMISLLETFRINWGADGFWHQDLDSLRANHGFKGVWFEVLSAFDWLISHFHASEAYGNHSWFFEATSISGEQHRFQLHGPDLPAPGGDVRFCIQYQNKPSTQINAFPLEEAAN